jgi:hypothetical protein
MNYFYKFHVIVRDDIQSEFHQHGRGRLHYKASNGISRSSDAVRYNTSDLQ